MRHPDKNGPIRAFFLAYLCLAIIGLIILSMPGMASRPLTNAEILFTNISAITLTGLQALDFAGLFTLQGQIAVLFLVQSGAIILVSLCLYFGYINHKGALFSDAALLTGKKTSPASAFIHILKKTALYFLVFELISSGILYAFWTGDISYTPSQKLYYAVFHGISVFCHSGFSNLEGNFSNSHITHSYLLMLAVSGVMLLGSIGYAATFELISIKRLRERMKNPTINWNLQTRITIFSTLILMVSGSVTWFWVEYNHTLYGKKLLEGAFTTFLNVSGSRTAGFYTVSPGAVSPALIILYIILMIAGTSAAAVGGGFKSSFFYLASRYLDKIFLILAGFTLWMLTGMVILHFTETGISGTSLGFELISAFTNTGLSFGITPHLSEIGKDIIMINMLAGRIGIPVLFYLVFAKKQGSINLLLN